MRIILITLLTTALLACSAAPKNEQAAQTDSTTVTYEQVAAESSAILDQLNNAAAEINRQCPVQIDVGTRLDSANAASGTELQYFYTLTALVRDEVVVAKLEETTKPMLIETVKTNPALANLRDHSITMTYLYRDRLGTFVMRIPITPADYGN